MYGGAAGGGKTDLILAVARFEHWRSVIFRRVYPSLRAIIDRSREMYNPYGQTAGRDSYNESLHRWKFASGQSVQFGAMQYDKDALDWQGQPHDFYGFDEVTEFTEKQFRFVKGWNRSTRPTQRCRVIGTGNPPTMPEGEWVIPYWGPWLDPTHPRPALPGELRWFTTIDGKDRELEDDRPVAYKNTTLWPRARTFIPAKVQDNPHLVSSGYVSVLQALPEPLRSKMLYGDFRAGREDDAYQCIPSAWVQLAQDRWRKREKPTTPMTAVGCDVARGGRDETVVAPRWDNYVGELVIRPGAQTPDGASVAQLVVAVRRDSARINIDVIGVGSSPFDLLRSQFGADLVIPMVGSAESTARDKSGLLGFVNARSEWYWKVREALDPASGQDLALPPDPRIKSDLCAPHWRLTPRGVQVESKDDITKRIGRSPDRGDAVVYALATPTVPGQGLVDWMKAQVDQQKREQEEAKRG